MTDIGAELYEAIKAEFDKTVAQDRYIQALSGRIEAGTVAPKDISLYAQQLGLRLRQAIERLVSADKLPNGQMYYNIAEKILRPSLKTNYELFNAVAAEIQTAVDKKQGIRIAAQQAELPKERIDAVINAASEPGIPEETMLRRMSVPAETITRSFADDFAKANADFRTRAGIEEFIVRRDDGSCCEWCAKLAGKFRYPVEVPHDVWRRHDNCGCTVEHQSGGMSTNVHTKQTRQLSEEQREQIAQAELKKQTVFSPEESAKAEAEQLAKRKGRLTDGDESGIITYRFAASKGFSLGDKIYTVVEDLEGVNAAYLFAKNVLHTGNINFSAVKNGEVLIPLLEQLKKLQDKHHIHFYQIFVKTLEDSVFAEVAPDLSLHLNTTYINSKEALNVLIKAMKKDHLLPKGHENLYYLITHEYMHFVSRSEVDSPRSKLQKLIPKDEAKRKKHLPSLNSQISPAEYVADAMAMVEFDEHDPIWDKIYNYFFGEGGVLP